LISPDVRTAEDRSTLAIGALVIFAGVTLIPLVAIVVKATSVEDISKILQVLLAPIVGVVGTVMGFYFGNKDNS